MNDRAIDPRVELAQGIFLSFNESHVDYAVVSGLDNYPTNIGRDIDVLLLKKSLQKAILLVYAAGDALGWDYAWVNNTRIGVYQIYLVKINSDGAFLFFQVDFIFNEFSALVGAAPVYELDLGTCFKELINYHGIYINPSIYRLKAVARKTILTGVRPAVPELVQRIAGGDSAFDSADSWNSFVEEKFVLDKKGLEIDFSRSIYLDKLALNISYLARRPFKFIYNLICVFPVKKIASFVSSKPYCVACVGPDGVGKSTTLAGVREIFEGVFQVYDIHFRYKALDRILRRKTTGVVHDPHCNAVKSSQGYLGAVLRLVYFFLDFWVSYLILRWRADPSRNTLILVDRGPLDAVIDPIRYRIRSHWFGKQLWRIVPKPNFQLGLFDEPQKIFDRKPELEKKEIQRQISRISELHDAGIINKLYRSRLDLFKEVSKDILFEFSNYVYLNNSGIIPGKKKFEEVYIDGRKRLTFINRSVRSAEVLRYLGWSVIIARVIYVNFCLLFRIGRVKIRSNSTPRFPPLWPLISSPEDQLICLHPVDVYRRRVVVLNLTRDMVLKCGFSDEVDLVDRELSASLVLASKQWGSFRFVSYDCIFKSEDKICLKSRLVKDLGDPIFSWNEVVGNVYREIQTVGLASRQLSLDEIESCRELFSFDFSKYSEISYTFSYAHGDFTPGNIFGGGDEIYLLDWEFFDESAPRLVDPILFYFSRFTGGEGIDSSQMSLFVKTFSPDVMELAMALRVHFHSKRLSRVEVLNIFNELQKVV